MSRQTPDGDPSPQPAASGSDPVTAEPDAETARVPLEPPAPDAASKPPSPPTPPPTSTPPPGIISANPVGWTAPPDDTTGAAPPEGPLVAWAAPAPQLAVPVTEGLVIAGVFSRVVAYSADLLFLAAINRAVVGLLEAYSPRLDASLALVVSGILIGVEFLYFVGLWTSGLQGTLGMRLIGLRVLGAATAGRLSVNDAVLRWLALSGALAIISLVPEIGPYVGLLGLLWLMALLISTSTNRLHQGLHDRWARSVVVQPAPGGSGAAIATCLVLVVFVGVILPAILLALYGDQIQSILSRIGDSI
jgi:uncharacterized RDD family membrane protein YckC